jgi:hypothetical protein
MTAQRLSDLRHVAGVARGLYVATTEAWWAAYQGQRGSPEAAAIVDALAQRRADLGRGAEQAWRAYELARAAYGRAHPEALDVAP